MKRITLDNGLKIFIHKKDSKYISLQVTVKAGPRNEEDNNRGISHFLEHMVFEGTTNRTPQEIAREIEGIGGEIGAYTSFEKTAFYVNCLKRYFHKAVEILADVVFNPLLEEKMIEKERSVVLSEISMGKDEPRRHQWTLFLNSLYTKHPLKHPIIGYEEIVKNITKEDMSDYHKKFYIPSNMIISAVGDIEDAEIIKKYFNTKEISKIQTNKIKKTIIKEPKIPAKKSSKIKRNISQSYLVVGCKTLQRDKSESYALDVIRSILGKGLSGRLFNEIRTKRGLAYDLGINNEALSDTGFFSFYASAEKTKLEKCRKIFFEEIEKLEEIDDEEITEAKNFLEGEFIMENEDNHDMADALADWEIISKVDDYFSYVKNIRKVTKKDIISAKNDLLNNFTESMIEQG